jgi:hypothetical protein
MCISRWGKNHKCTASRIAVPIESVLFINPDKSRVSIDTKTGAMKFSTLDRNITVTVPQGKLGVNVDYASITSEATQTAEIKSEDQIIGVTSQSGPVTYSSDLDGSIVVKLEDTNTTIAKITIEPTFTRIRTESVEILIYDDDRITKQDLPGGIVETINEGTPP